MKNVIKESIEKSRLEGSDKYLHTVFLNTSDDSEYEVVIIRHNNWGVGQKEVKSFNKKSLNDARELYNFYVEELKSSVSK